MSGFLSEIGGEQSRPDVVYDASCWYNKGMKSHRLYRSETWLRSQYIDNARSGTDIAKECKCDLSVIYYWLRKHGIGVRSNSEAQTTSYNTNPERRAQRSENQAQLWDDPEYRARQMAVRTDEEWRAQHSELIKATWEDSEKRQKYTEGFRRREMNPEHRERRRQNLLAKYADPEWRAWKRQIVAEAWRRLWADPDFRTKTTTAVRAKWQDPAFREGMARRMSAMASRQTGANNHCWNGGLRRYYGENWLEQRRQARRRDSHTCQHCQITQQEAGRNLDVHHIRPFRDFGYIPGKNDHYLQANDLDNLITLCRRCHKLAES
jgi:hypothetical protein